MQRTTIIAVGGAFGSVVLLRASSYSKALELFIDVALLICLPIIFIGNERRVKRSKKLADREER